MFYTNLPTKSTDTNKGQFMNIIFDSAGGIVLQTTDYCHFYNTDAAQAAEDAYKILDGESTEGWDNNQPEFRVDLNEFRATDGRYIHRFDIDELAHVLITVSGESERTFLKALLTKLIADF